MAKLTSEEQKEIVIDDLRTVIDELRMAEATQGLWDKEVIAIQNAINYILNKEFLMEMN